MAPNTSLKNLERWRKMVSTRGAKVRFCEGEKVLCYEPDPTKAKVLYESKVLEICVTKDGKKRKSVEYLVHFNGWSNSWDRFVPEEFILKDNDENRALQRRLTEAAAIYLNVKKKKRRLPEIFKEVLNRKKCSEVEADVWKGSDDLTNQSSESSSESESDEEEETTLINLEIPNALKKQLELDYSLVKLNKKLVKLPREPNIIDILEGYIKTYATNTLCATPEKPKGSKSQVNAERNINLCKEVMDGLRIYFDFTLPLVLLFDEEKIQHEYLISHYKPNCVENDIRVSSSDCVSVDIPDEMPLASYSSNKSPVVVSLEIVHPTHFSSKSPTRDLSPRSCRSSSNRTPKRELLDDPSEPECPKRILRSSANRQDTEIKQEETDVSQTDEEHKTVLGDHNDDKQVKGVKGHPPRQCALATVTRLRNRSGASSPPGGAVNALSPTVPHGTDTLPQRVQPPPPLQIPGHISSLSSSSSRSGPPTPTLHSSLGPVEITSSLDETMSWKMIPPKVYHQIPPPPSLIYGAQHLLRLFVKLPEMVKRTNIADRKLDMLLMHLEFFLKYLDNRKGEFFAEDAYEDMPEDYKPIPLLVDSATTNEVPES